MQWKFHPRNSPFEPLLDSPTTFINNVFIEQHGFDPEESARPLAGTVDESYNLTIKEDGQVSISASTSNGILYALETFTQLFYQHSQSANGIYTPFAPVEIKDKPKFPHRGLNMDISRSFYAVSDIKHAIDTLAWNKFNRLHLHASDAQSWPVQIPALPELAQHGAYARRLSYSADELREIQVYGLFRGVEIIIEFDMPGHTHSIGLSYPDLIVASNKLPNWNDYSAQPPSGQLKLKSEGVYKFLDTLWNDILPRVSPYSAYFHTGGGEVNANAYNFEPGLTTNDTAVLQPLL